MSKCKNKTIENATPIKYATTKYSSKLHGCANLDGVKDYIMADLVCICKMILILKTHINYVKQVMIVKVFHIIKLHLMVPIYVSVRVSGARLIQVGQLVM